MQVSEAAVTVLLATQDKGDDKIAVRFDMKANTLTFLKKDKVLFTLSACAADQASTYLKKIHKAAMPHEANAPTIATDVSNYAGALGGIGQSIGLNMSGMAAQASRTTT